MRYFYKVNGSLFRSATRAIAYIARLRKAGEAVNTVSINNEPCLIYELEQAARMEKAEREHNKRQGL